MHSIDSDGNPRVPFLPSFYSGMGALFSQRYAAREPAYRNPHQALIGESLDLYSVLGEALSQMSESVRKEAVENALGGGPFKGKPLAERRRLMAEHLGISERTLYRRESVGSVELVAHIEALVDAQPSHPDGEASELAALRGEVRELKEMIARLESALTPRD